MLYAVLLPYLLLYAFSQYNCLEILCSFISTITYNLYVTQILGLQMPKLCERRQRDFMSPSLVN